MSSKTVNVRVEEKILKKIFDKIGKDGNLSDFVRLAINNELGRQINEEKAYKKLLMKFENLNLTYIKDDIREIAISMGCIQDNVSEKLEQMDEAVKIRTPEFRDTKLNQKLEGVSNLIENQYRLINNEIGILSRETKTLNQKSVTPKTFLLKLTSGVISAVILSLLFSVWAVYHKINAYTEEKDTYLAMVTFLNHSCEIKKSYADFYGIKSDCKEVIK